VSRKRRQRSSRPAPIAGVQAAQTRILSALSKRSDRFSDLLSRVAKSEQRGQVLMTSSCSCPDLGL